MAADEHSATWQGLMDLAGQPREGSSAPSGVADATRMSLASAGGSDGSGTAGNTPTGKLKQSAGPWTKAAGVADALEASMRTSRDKLSNSHQAVASEGSGLASIDALNAVRDSWQHRLDDARKECTELHGKLIKTAEAHCENELQAKSSFQGKGQDRGTGRHEGGR